MTQRSHSISSMIAAVAAAAALGLPGMASAEYLHPTSDEVGVVVHADHFKSEKTRAQVRAEAEAAVQQGLQLRRGQLPASGAQCRTGQDARRSGSRVAERDAGGAERTHATLQWGLIVG